MRIKGHPLAKPRPLTFPIPTYASHNSMAIIRGLHRDLIDGKKRREKTLRMPP